MNATIVEYIPNNMVISYSMEFKILISIKIFRESSFIFFFGTEFKYRLYNVFKQHFNSTLCTTEKTYILWYNSRFWFFSTHEINTKWKRIFFSSKLFIFVIKLEKSSMLFLHITQKKFVVFRRHQKNRFK